MLGKSFPGGSVVENSPANAGDMGLIPGSRRSPGEGNGNPFQYGNLLPGKSHGQRSLVGYSPWSHKEQDTTERISTAQHIFIMPPVISGMVARHD